MASSTLQNTVFETSVDTAVSRSVQGQIPLVVFVADQSEESQRWSNELLGNQEIIDLITHYSVALKLQNGSVEAEQFSQVFAIMTVPALYIVNNGAMVDYIYGSLTLDAFLERVKKALVPAESGSGSVSTTTTSATSDEANIDLSSQPLPASSSSVVSPSISNASHANVIHATEHRSSSEAISESKPDVAKYQDTLRRKRAQEDEERQRILKLLKDDRQERKSRAVDLGSTTSETKKLDRSSKNDFHRHNDSALAIRLFDGSLIKNRFGLDATLGDVRVWIDSNRTDGDGPYSIISQFPLKDFTASDENVTLVDLGLHPTATLILKPIIHYSNAFTPSTTLGRLQNGAVYGIHRVIGAVGTFLGWGYREPVAQSTEEHAFRVPNLSAHTSVSSSSQLSNSRSTSPTGTQTLQDIGNSDDEDRRTYNGNHLTLEDDS
ncbi:uncharacterized protein V1516DRAFT_681577 [Lipomyces oligophaga]|uniref:uncharacterized protein n=1 Tax=Lipomyces oligophaga TaxID=45792 RepID=UPI0034CEE04E